MPINLSLKMKILEKFPTQADFAKVAGTTENVVSEVIRDRRPVTDEIRNKWSKILRVKPESIFEDVNTPGR